MRNVFGRLILLSAVFTIAGACKPRSYKASGEEQSVQFVPLTEQKGGALHTLQVAINLNSILLYPARLDNLPPHLVDYLTEGKRTNMNSVDFRLVEKSLGNQTGQCWYYTSISNGTKETHALTEKFVTKDAIFSEARNQWNNQGKPVLGSKELEEGLEGLSGADFQNCARGQNVCSVQGTVISTVFLHYFFPAIVATSKKGFLAFWETDCPSKP